MDYVVIGAGDIADCDYNHHEKTSLLLSNANRVVVLGDNVYPRGSLQSYQNCFDPWWGQYKNIMLPVVGNHEYLTPNAAGYKAYFETDQTYYSQSLGSWLIIVLDSERHNDQAQLDWLRGVLSSDTHTCLLALWHHPLYSSQGGDTDVREFWRILYRHRADVILNGHDHFYERFRKQDDNGNRRDEGIRGFIVGTGGARLNRQSQNAKNSVKFTNDHHGVIRLDLRKDSYKWQFIRAGGKIFDSGQDNCNSK